MTTSISKDFQFSASHQLDGLPDDHPCSRLHGHNYTVRLTLEGQPGPVGFIVDYRDLAPFGDWLDEQFDHRHLNDMVGFNPTAEHLAAWLVNVAVDLVDLPDRVAGVAVAVSETPKTWATVRLAPVPRRAGVPDDERYRWGR